MRYARFILAALVVVAPLGAQQQQGSALPAGWMSRFDKAGGTAKFAVMGPGFHVTSADDGAAIYYSAKDIGTGVYSVTAKFSQSKPSGHEGGQREEACHRLPKQELDVEDLILVWHRRS